MAKRATKTIEHDQTLFGETPAQPKEKETKAAKKKREPKAAKRAEPKPAKSTAVAVAKAAPPAVLSMTDPAQMITLIGNMAMNKDVDADKFEKLLLLQERMMDRQSRMAFDENFRIMWPKFPAMVKDGLIEIESRERTGNRGGNTRAQATPYAKWETAMPVLRPILVEHGFTLTHRIGAGADGCVRVTAVLKGWGHTDDTCFIDLPSDVGGSKNNVQARVSSVSYAKRHTAFAVLNITTRGEDDDGKGSGPPVVVGQALDADDVEQLRSYCEAAGLDEKRLIARMNETKPKGHPDAKELKDIPKSRFDEASTRIRDYGNEKARREKEGQKK